MTLRLTDDEAADLDWLLGVTGAKDRSAGVRHALSRVVAAEKRKTGRAKAGAE